MTSTIPIIVKFLILPIHTLLFIFQYQSALPTTLHPNISNPSCQDHTYLKPYVLRVAIRTLTNSLAFNTYIYSHDHFHLLFIAMKYIPKCSLYINRISQPNSILSEYLLTKTTKATSYLSSSLTALTSISLFTISSELFTHT